MISKRDGRIIEHTHIDRQACGRAESAPQVSFTIAPARAPDAPRLERARHVHIPEWPSDQKRSMEYGEEHFGSVLQEMLALPDEPVFLLDSNRAQAHAAFSSIRRANH